jgi:hypothetical protein
MCLREPFVSFKTNNNNKNIQKTVSLNACDALTDKPTNYMTTEPASSIQTILNASTGHNQK